MGPESPWGMVIHYPNEHLIDVLRQGGVSWIRNDVQFAVQPKPGNPPNWGGAVLETRAAYQRPEPTQETYFGIDASYPPWIAEGQQTNSEAWRNRFNHWEAFVRLAVQTFGGDGDMRARYFHIGNEPNDKDGKFFRFGQQEYLELLVRAVRVIRAAGPPDKYKVCAPDIATDDDHRPWDFLRACLRKLQSEGQTLDVISVHGYIGGDKSAQNLISRLSPVTRVLREFGLSTPVWLTETGVGNHGTGAEENPRAIRELCSWVGEGPKFLKKVFFYIWSEDEEPGADRGKYAWLQHSLQPIPQLWNAYKAVTGETHLPKPRKLNATVTEVPGLPPFPRRLRPREQRTVTLRATNTGTQVWTPELNFGFGHTQARLGPVVGRVTRRVHPNESHDFTFTLTAPPTISRFWYSWQMFQGELPFGTRFAVLITVE